MNAADEAIAFANSVFDRIPELVVKTMKQRRADACWHKLKCERRLQTCWPINRWIWRARVNVHDARCYANEHIHAQITAACEALARERAA